MIKLSDILELYSRPEAEVTSDDDFEPDTEHDKERGQFGSENIQEEDPCWKGYRQYGMKDKDGKEVPNCVPIKEDELTEGEFCPECLIEVLEGLHEGQLGEAEYHGRKVSLGKPVRTPDGPKKFSVYVKNKKGNTIKVNFGDPKMKIKKSIPSRRKSFRARHRCQTAKDRTTARYWSCRAW